MVYQVETGPWRVALYRDGKRQGLMSPLMLQLATEERAREICERHAANHKARGWPHEADYRPFNIEDNTP